MQPIAVAIDRHGGCGQTSAQRSSKRPSASRALLGSLQESDPNSGIRWTARKFGGATMQWLSPVTMH